MKVLFVSSGNSSFFKITPFIYAQGESLKQFNVEVDYLPIVGKGIQGYFKNIKPLTSLLQSKKYDVIHAHYGLTGWVAVLASKLKVPVVLSLMGDDAYGRYDANGNLILKTSYLILLTKLIQPFVNHIIVKSDNIAEKVYLKNKLSIIPNGVDTNVFKEITKCEASEKLGKDKSKKYVLFVSDVNNPRKNFALCKKAVELVNDPEVVILLPYPINHNELPLYYNLADVMVFTSTAEGSPNVIKEAMACRCPIVSTDIGDVKWVFGNTDGCYITSFEPEDVAEKLKLALDFGKTVGKTKGKERIVELELDSETTAKKIISIYKQLINK